MRFAVLLTYREVFRQEPSHEDLGRILSKYKRAELLFLFAKVNCLLTTWQNKPNYDIDAKLVRLFLPHLSSAIREMQRLEPPRVVFSRSSLLFLMKQACQLSPDEGRAANTAEAHGDVGRAILLANDLLLPCVPKSEGDKLKKAANLLPFSDYISTDHCAIEIGRSGIMFDEIAVTQKIKQRKDFLDLGGLFQRSFDISHTEFAQMVFCCAAKFLMIKEENLASREALVIRPTFFQKSIASDEVVSAFFRHVAISESQLAERVRESAERPPDDFTLLQSFPLVEIAPKVYTCLDPGFFMDKAGRSMYWALFSALSQNEKKRLPGFWGAVFEDYVNSILSGSYGANGVFIPEPKFPNGDPAFDACLLEGSRLVVFEHKSSFLRADCKYGGDSEKLLDELELKFIEGEADGAKGLAQLKNGLLRFLKGEPINGIRAEAVNTIYPALVCLDTSMAVPFIGSFLADKFHEMLPRKSTKKRVTPVFTLNVADVENLLGYLRTLRLTDILDSFYERDKKLLTSMSFTSVPLLKGIEPGLNPVRQKFLTYTRALAENLFGAEAVAAAAASTEASPAKAEPYRAA